MSSTTSNVDLLEIDFRTLFILDQTNRILKENEPIPSTGPQFWLARCSEGQVYGFHVDVDDSTIAEIKALIANDLTIAEGPGHQKLLPEYLALLRPSQIDPGYNFGLIYYLTHTLEYPSSAASSFVFSNSKEATGLLQSWQMNSMPAALLDLGFHSIADIWPPWCAAMVEDKVASLAFAARLSDEGAELGLVTVKEFRGRGLGAAVTAAWTRHPELEGRELFFSLDVKNDSSKKVAERLGLRRIGWSLRVY